MISTEIYRDLQRSTEIWYIVKPLWFTEFSLSFGAFYLYPLSEVASRSLAHKIYKENVRDSNKGHEFIISVFASNAFFRVSIWFKYPTLVIVESFW